MIGKLIAVLTEREAMKETTYENCPENPLDLTLCKSCADVFFDSKKYYIVLALTDLDERSYCDICHQRKGRDLLLYERRNKGGGANGQNNCTR